MGNREVLWEKVSLGQRIQFNINFSNDDFEAKEDGEVLRLEVGDV